MNEENFCCSKTRKCLPSSSDRQPDLFCSRRRPSSRENEIEAVILRLPCLPASVPTSRWHTRELLASWRIAPSAVDMIALVVSELVTNAVQHSVGRKLPLQPDPHPRHFELAIYLTAKHVRVEVYDEEHRLPVEVEPLDYAETGRGIKIIQFFVSRWGSRRTCTGKVIWCDVILPEPSNTGDAAIQVRSLQL